MCSGYLNSDRNRHTRIVDVVEIKRRGRTLVNDPVSSNLHRTKKTIHIISSLLYCSITFQGEILNLFTYRLRFYIQSHFIKYDAFYRLNHLKVYEVFRITSNTTNHNFKMQFTFSFPIASITFIQ